MLKERDMHAKVIIVGSGPAGYTAAIYAARSMLEPSSASSRRTAHHHHRRRELSRVRRNHPGPVAHGADARPGRACRHQADFRPYLVGRPVAPPLPAERRFRRGLWLRHANSGDRGAGQVAGSSERAPVQGSGVSACATCDGFFYKNREVVVVGGGNTAVEEALYLTHFASRVTVVHRREPSAPRRYENRLFANDKIRVIWDTVVDDIIGTSGPPPSVTGVRLKNVRTGATSDLRADGVFVAIGHAPSVDLVGNQLRMKPSGYIWTAPNSTATSIPGVFAAGDVTDDIYRQAVTAARAAWRRSRPTSSWHTAGRRRRSRGIDARRWTGTSSASSTPPRRPARSPMPARTLNMSQSAVSRRSGRSSRSRRHPSPPPCPRPPYPHRAGRAPIPRRQRSPGQARGRSRSRLDRRQREAVRHAQDHHHRRPRLDLADGRIHEFSTSTPTHQPATDPRRRRSSTWRCARPTSPSACAGRCSRT